MTLLRLPILPAADQRGTASTSGSSPSSGSARSWSVRRCWSSACRPRPPGCRFLATHGSRVLGLSSNGLLTALSLVVAAIPFWAAVRGPGSASTVTIVLGVLFLLSALGNLAVLHIA